MAVKTGTKLTLMLDDGKPEEEEETSIKSSVCRC